MNVIRQLITGESFETFKYRVDRYNNEQRVKELFRQMNKSKVSIRTLLKRNYLTNKLRYSH